MATEGKPCECHGVPLLWAQDRRYRLGGFWRCRIRHAERQRGYYEALDGLRYSRKLLQNRRTKALARQAARHERHREAL